MMRHPDHDPFTKEGGRSILRAFETLYPYRGRYPEARGGQVEGKTPQGEGEVRPPETVTNPDPALFSAAPDPAARGSPQRSPLYREKPYVRTIRLWKLRNSERNSRPRGSMKYWEWPFSRSRRMSLRTSS